MSAIEVKVPDIGDFKDVPVIEIPVKPGDVVKVDDPLIVLESDKASMEVPSPAAGKVLEILVKLGDKVGEGSLILRLEAEGAAPAAAAVAAPAAAAAAKPARSRIAVTDLDAGAPDQPRRRSSARPIIRPTSPPIFPTSTPRPSVRRLARELELDLTKVTGTGDKGRITKEDVKAFLGGGKAARPGRRLRRLRHSGNPDHRLFQIRSDRGKAAVADQEIVGAVPAPLLAQRARRHPA